MAYAGGVRSRERFRGCGAVEKCARVPERRRIFAMGRCPSWRGSSSAERRGHRAGQHEVRRGWQCHPWAALANMLPGLKASDAGWTAEAMVPVRLMQGDSRLILLGPRQGGQRYLRDDLDALANAAAEIVVRLESLRREELARLMTQAELRALQSQINPHFLFNALNTLYGTIPREAGGARKMVLNLAE